MLVYIDGPPAVGKLTVAQQLAAWTGYVLFPNHLTLNAVAAVVPPSSPSFEPVLNRVRLLLLAEAISGGRDVIFTNNSAWSGVDSRERFAAFAAATRKTVQGAGGRTLFVHLHAPLEVLESRVVRESHEPHGKFRDVGELRRLLEGYEEGPLKDDHLSVGTSSVAPTDAARLILARFPPIQVKPC